MSFSIILYEGIEGSNVYEGYYYTTSFGDLMHN